ncbi:MAG: hypothetical protein LQ338_008011 [Usnochroma carphineum]|nr:MAG: hypothetical protein LQ338_008011 [Usnochroma carphineum]
MRPIEGVLESQNGNCRQPEYRNYHHSAEAFFADSINYDAVHEKKYTKEHEWIELNDDKTQGTIGISHYAASALGDVVYVELPALDLEVSAGDSIGAVESVKSASDIMTPVSGKIIAANEKLEEKPGTINKGPEDEGWIARIEVGDAKEVEGLMGLEEYRKFTEE